MSRSSSEGVKNYYRFGIPEKAAFKNKSESYYGVSVSAHIAAYYSTSIKEFLRTLGKPFFIDPMTYVFTRDPEHIKRKGKLRKSYRKLAEKYGGVIEKASGKSPLDYRAFRDDEAINELVTNVLSFQREILRRPHISLQKYFDILGEEAPEELEAPEFLVAPYFYASTYEDPWYEISLRSAARANDLKENSQLYAVICIYKDMLLDSATISKIIDDYAEFDGLIYWVSSNVDEENEDQSYLEALKSFVSLLAELKKPIYSLFGGYFTAMLSKYGLTGYSSGICYGENRHVDAHATGGGQPRRYYLSLSHTKILESDARTFFSDYSKGNHRLLCSCSICEGIKRAIVEGFAAQERIIDPVQFIDRFFSRISMIELREHFMERRRAELSNIYENTLTNLTQEMVEEHNKCHELGFSRYPGLRYAHLDKWKQAL